MKPWHYLNRPRWHCQSTLERHTGQGSDDFAASHGRRMRCAFIEEALTLRQRYRPTIFNSPRFIWLTDMLYYFDSWAVLAIVAPVFSDIWLNFISTAPWWKPSKWGIEWLPPMPGLDGELKKLVSIKEGRGVTICRASWSMGWIDGHAYRPEMIIDNSAITKYHVGTSMEYWNMSLWQWCRHILAQKLSLVASWRSIVGMPTMKRSSAKTMLPNISVNSQPWRA